MRAVYFSSDDGFEFQRLTRLDLSTGEYKYFLPQVRWDVEAIEVAPDGRQLAVVTNEGGASKLRVLDSMTGELLWNPQMPSGVIHQLVGLRIRI